MDSDKEKLLAEINSSLSRAVERWDGANPVQLWIDAEDAIAALPFFAAPSPAQAVGGEQRPLESAFNESVVTMTGYDGVTQRVNLHMTKELFDRISDALARSAPEAGDV
jgi:hypothetical protein